jgi:hypothetical protein
MAPSSPKGHPEYRKTHQNHITGTHKTKHKKQTQAPTPTPTVLGRKKNTTAMKPQQIGN